MVQENSYKVSVNQSFVFRFPKGIILKIYFLNCTNAKVLSSLLHFEKFMFTINLQLFKVAVTSTTFLIINIAFKTNSVFTSTVLA